MLTLRGIDASFTLVRIGDQIHISGRSAGKVNVTVQGQYSEFSAITTADYIIPTGAYVRIVAVDEAGTLVVEPVSDLKNN